MVKTVEKLKNLDIELLVLARYFNIKGFEYREHIIDSHIDYIELRIPSQKPVGKIWKNKQGILIEFFHPLIRSFSKAYELRFHEQITPSQITTHFFYVAYLIGFMPSRIEMDDYRFLLKFD